RVVKWVRRKPALAGLIGVSAFALISLVVGGAYFTHNLHDALDLANRDRYAADMNLARRAWDDKEVYRAREFLDKYRDTASGLSDYRSFEWYYLWKLCNPDQVVLSGHQGPVLAVAYSPDGRKLASGGTDRTVRLWEPGRDRTALPLKGHEGTILALAFAPDGKVLASGSADGTVCLWDTASGELQRSRKVSPRSVICLAFSPDGQTLALSTDLEDRIFLLNIELKERFILSSAEGAAEQVNVT